MPGRDDQSGVAAFSATRSPIAGSLPRSFAAASFTTPLPPPPGTGQRHRRLSAACRPCAHLSDGQRSEPTPALRWPRTAFQREAGSLPVNLPRGVSQQLPLFSRNRRCARSTPQWSISPAPLDPPRGWGHQQPARTRTSASPSIPRRQPAFPPSPDRAHLQPLARSLAGPSNPRSVCDAPRLRQVSRNHCIRPNVRSCSMPRPPIDIDTYTAAGAACAGDVRCPKSPIDRRRTSDGGTPSHPQNPD